MSDYLKLSLKGFLMGAADVIPGVSGGTMAFIMGIYEELVQAIRSFDLAFVRRLFSLRILEAFNGTGWKFLLTLGTGILVAIFTLAKVLSWLLVNEPILIWSFFFGLILASVVTVTKKIKRFSPLLILWVVLGATMTYFIVGVVPLETPKAGWFLFLSGAVAICAMILPGISGAFILVLLGKYQYVLEAVNNRDFLTLSIVALGAVCGLILFSRLLNWLFTRHHDLTIALLCGLMLGSLRKIWPFKVIGQDSFSLVVERNVLPASLSSELMLALALASLGVFLVLVLDRWAEKTGNTANREA